MNTNNNNNESDFHSPDDAFEFLVNKRLDEKRRKEWTEALGKKPSENQEVRNGKAKIKKIYFQVASIAAAVLLIGGFFLFNQKVEPLSQYAGNVIEESKIRMNYGSAVRGDNNNGTSQDVQSLRNELTMVLLDEDFNQALGYFRQLEKLTSLSTEDKYYYAIALLKTKGEYYSKAIRMLNDVVNEKDANQMNAIWFRALAYGMIDNSALMKKDLSELNSESKKRNKEVMDLLLKY